MVEPNENKTRKVNDMTKSKWYKIGNQRGYDEGLDSFPRTDWMDKKTALATAHKIMEGVEYGDIECRDPLSGEWAGESLVEIFGRNPTEQMMQNYETGFRDGFYSALVSQAKHEKQRFQN